MSKLQEIFEARTKAAAELRAIYEAAGNEPLGADEAATEARLSSTIVELDKRMKSMIDLEASDKAAREAEARAIPATNTSDDTKPSINDQLRKLARGEIRGGLDLETRATLKSNWSVTPTSVDSNIVEYITNESNVLNAGARVITTASGEALIVPVITAGSVATLVGEGADIGTSDPTTATVQLGAYKYAFLTSTSSEFAQDAGVNIAAYLAQAGGIALGAGFGAHAAAGTGTNQPQGINKTTNIVTAASATALTYDDLVNLVYSVPTVSRNNAAFVTAAGTMAALRKLKDTTGQPLWQPAIALGQPDTIMGARVFTDTSFDAIATGKVVAVYGDMSGYTARIAGPVRVDVSSEHQFQKDLVTWRFVMRADGRVTNPSVLAALKMA